MNIYAWIFAAPILVLVIFNPLEMVPVLIASAVAWAVCLWLFDLAVGPKPPPRV